MRIAFDSQIFSAQEYGGISRYFCEIAPRLARSPGVTLSIAAPLHVNAYLAELPPPLNQGRRVKGSGLLRVPVRMAGIAASDWCLRRLSPDVIHETYYSPWATGPKSAPRVLTVYDMAHERFPETQVNSGKTSRFKALAARRADHIICISESTRRELIDLLGVPAGKTSVIYLATSMTKVEPDAQLRARLPQRPYLLYVGSRSGYKNFPRLLQAYAGSPRLRNDFDLLCFGGGAWSATEKAEMSRLQLDPARLHCSGGDDRLLAQAYLHARVFVYPSQYEGFGIPPLEAMAQQCPVACGRNSSIPEVVGEAGAYFDASDPDSIRAAVESLACDDTERAKVIPLGNQRVAHFSWDRCAMETLAVYRQLG